MRRTALTLLCISVFLLSLRATHATTGDILTNLRKQLFSLHLQGAPIPEELLEMFERREDLPDGEISEPFLTEEERWQRVQTHLSSLAAHADIVAEKSSLAADDIRALATDLRRKWESAQSEDDRTALMKRLKKVEGEIFPENDAAFASFAEGAQTLLSEIPDLLALTRTQGSKNATDALEEETQNLERALAYLSDGGDVALFMKRFDALAYSIVSLLPPSPPPLLKEDLLEFLTHFKAYFDAIAQKGIGDGTGQERIGELRKTLNTVASEQELEAFLGSIEDLLTKLPEQAVSLPMEP